jgi:hypothetical protein
LETIGASFKFTPNTLKVISRVFSFSCNNMFTLIQTTCREGRRSTLIDHFKKITWPFLFQHHLWHVFLLASNVLEVLCKVECRSLAICSPCHPMLSFTLWCFLLYIVDYIRPPTSSNSQSDTLHLWLVIKCHGDPPPPLCPWCGRTASHDVVQNTFTSIVRYANFMFCENKPTFF